MAFDETAKGFAGTAFEEILSPFYFCQRASGGMLALMRWICSRSLSDRKLKQ